VLTPENPPGFVLDFFVKYAILNVAQKLFSISCSFTVKPTYPQALFLTSEPSFTYTENINNLTIQQIMSQHQAYKVIVGEIEMLNKEIDMKIIKGLSYADESRRHKTLLARLKHATPDRSWWFKRSVNLISALVF